MEGNCGSTAELTPLLVLQGWSALPTALQKGRTSRSPLHAGSSQAWWRRPMLATAACRPAGTCRWSPSWGPRASEQAHLRARTPSPTPGLLSCFLPLSSTALPRTSPLVTPATAGCCPELCQPTAGLSQPTTTEPVPWASHWSQHLAQRGQATCPGPHSWRGAETGSAPRQCGLGASVSSPCLPLPLPAGCPHHILPSRPLPKPFL